MIYTKGEWKVIECPAEHRLHDEYVVRNEDGFIATITHLNNIAKEEANAHLIAAAPDMYQACKDALEALQSMTTKDFQNGGDKAIRKQLKLALNKAEGR